MPHIRSRGHYMARGRTTSLTIHLPPAHRRTLLAWQRATRIPAGLARRGRIILLVADGIPIAHVAATVGISRRFVYKWVQRFQDKGLEGLIANPARGSRRVSRQPILTERHASDVGERQHIACRRCRCTLQSAGADILDRAQRRTMISVQGCGSPSSSLHALQTV